MSCSVVVLFQDTSYQTQHSVDKKFTPLGHLLLNTHRGPLIAECPTFFGTFLLKFGALNILLQTILALNDLFPSVIDKIV